LFFLPQRLLGKILDNLMEKQPGIRIKPKYKGGLVKNKQRTELITFALRIFLPRKNTRVFS
jgi:hypothetical protein